MNHHQHDHAEHHHGHHHHHHAVPAEFNFAFGLSVLLNFGFVVAEIIYALFAHSTGLLADATHNLGDVLGLLMAWGATWLLGFSASERFSYGYKRTTIFAALANTLILVGSSVLIAYESVMRLWHPTIVNEKVVIIVAAIGILINAGTALLFRRHQAHDMNMKSAYMHLMGDAALSLGVVFSGIAMSYTQAYWLDPVVGLSIVGFILWSTWGLLRDTVNLLLDAVPQQVSYPEVMAYLEKIQGVEAVHDLHIWSLSTREVALTAHLMMPEKKLEDSDYAEINRVLREKFSIHHVTLQVEQGEALCGQTC